MHVLSSKPTSTPATRTPTSFTAPGLHVYQIGAGEPLVLLHGLGESHIGWRPVIGPLSDEYDVIAIDLPGFGRSPALPGRVFSSPANLADAIESTLDQLGVDTYHVAGYSLGARVAIQLAASPRVQSVIAIAPGGLGTPVERIQGLSPCSPAEASRGRWHRSTSGSQPAGRCSLPAAAASPGRSPPPMPSSSSPTSRTHRPMTPPTGQRCSTCLPICEPSPNPPCFSRAPPTS
jgi:pimeloyl-ACP methyl ester carboxylesterase